MFEALFLLVSLIKSSLKKQTELALENLALRQQLVILKRERPHARLRRRDRLFWVSLSAIWQRWRESLLVVKPETVVRWRRKGFALYWTCLSKHGAAGRPGTGKDIRELVCKMANANPTWGSSFSLTPAPQSFQTALGVHPNHDAIAAVKIFCRLLGTDLPKYGILARHS
jgi:hypothetical protein